MNIGRLYLVSLWGITRLRFWLFIWARTDWYYDHPTFARTWRSDPGCGRLSATTKLFHRPTWIFSTQSGFILRPENGRVPWGVTLPMVLGKLALVRGGGDGAKPSMRTRKPSPTKNRRIPFETVWWVREANLFNRGVLWCFVQARIPGQAVLGAGLFDMGCSPHGQISGIATLYWWKCGL